MEPLVIRRSGCEAAADWPEVAEWLSCAMAAPLREERGASNRIGADRIGLDQRGSDRCGSARSRLLELDQARSPPPPVGRADPWGCGCRADAQPPRLTPLPLLGVLGLEPIMIMMITQQQQRQRQQLPLSGQSSGASSQGSSNINDNITTVSQVSQQQRQRQREHVMSCRVVFERQPDRSRANTHAQGCSSFGFSCAELSCKAEAGRKQ